MGPLRFGDETIHIHELRVHCFIGAYPRERERLQPLVISASIPGDFGAAAADDLGRALDYGEVARAIREFTEQSRFRLLETLVRRLAEHLSERFGLERLSLHIRKPRALPDSEGAGVSLTVRREARP